MQMEMVSSGEQNNNPGTIRKEIMYVDVRGWS